MSRFRKPVRIHESADDGMAPTLLRVCRFQSLPSACAGLDGSMPKCVVWAVSQSISVMRFSMSFLLFFPFFAADKGVAAALPTLKAETDIIENG